jgi:5-methylthioadenosine/S-adenosylhomocysteine deaminase
MATKRTLIRNSVVITADPKLGDFERADVLIEGDCIASVGPQLAASDAEVIDGSRMIVMPGFVDTHRHNWQGVIRGVSSDWTLNEYLDGVLGRLSATFRPQDVYLSNLLGALEALDSGITTLLDWSHISNTPEHADEAIRGLKDAGIRAVYAHGAPGICWIEKDRRHPEDIRRIRTRHLTSDEGLITLMMAMRGPDFATFEATVDDVKLARDLGLRISQHVGVALVGKKERAITRMHAAGLLGADMTHIHCTTCTDDEMRLIADSGGSISVATRVEMSMGHGHPVTGRAIAVGIRPCLSLDVVTTVGSNFFDEMRAALLLERALRHQEALDRQEEVNKLALTASDVIEFATIEGARACGLADRVGSITPGKQADLLLLRRDTPDLVPLNHIRGMTVLAAGVRNIDTVFVAGRAVKKGGNLVGHDLERIYRTAHETRDYLFRTAGVPAGVTPVGMW